MKCPNCGHENRDVARFCRQCGAVLEPPAPEMPEAPDAEPAPAAEADWADETLIMEPPVEVAPTLAPAETVPAGEGEPEETEAVATAEAAAPVEVPAEVAVDTLWESADQPPVEEEVPAEPPAEVAPEMEEQIPLPEIKESAPPAAAEQEAPTGADEMPAPVWDAELESPLDSGEEQEELVPVEEETSAAEPETDEVPADALLWREEPAPLAPLEPGLILSGRYRIVELDQAQVGENRYQVRDLWRCPQCGYDRNSPDEAFCASCGAVLDQKPLATMLERPVAAAGQAGLPFEDHFVEGERAYWVWREGVDTGPLEEATRPLQLVVGYKSDTGRTRELDEDSLLVMPLTTDYEATEQVLALFVVADGMGGHEGGEVASKLAIRTMAELLMHTVFVPELSGRSLSPEQLLNWLRKACEAANDRVYMERRERGTDMGTTLTAALCKGADLYLAHVGDSRAYRWNKDGLEQLTTDHSIVASMVAAGSVKPEEIYTHPQRSVIYRCIGDQSQVQVDTNILLLSPGDRIILCSDGLWEMLRDEGIEEVMLREADPQRASEVLVDQANAAGGLDNISVIVIQF